MKRMLAVLLAAICLLCGCQVKQETVSAPTIEPYTYTNSVLYFIEGETIQAVDLEGRLITVENPQGIQLPEGSRADEAVEIQVKADGTASLELDYPYSFTYQQPIRANREEAPEAFARAKLEEMLGSSIWDYTLKDVAVVRETEGRIDFLMTYDLEVMRNAAEFSAYSPYEGNYGQGTLLTDQKRAVSILGNGQQWLNYEPLYFGDRQQLVTPKYAEFVPTANQTVLFGTEEAIYYQEKSYLPQNQEDVANGAPLAYDTMLWAQNRSSGERYQLSKVLHNYDLSFQDYADGKIYLKAFFWQPYAEDSPGGIFVIEEDARQARELQKLSLPVAMTKEAIYTMVSSYENDRWTVDLYAIEQSTAKLRHVCTIPDQSLGEERRLFTVHGQILRMDHYNTRNQKESFEIDLVSGDYKKIE